MSFTRKRTILLLGVLGVCSALSQATAQRWGRCTLNPKSYKSPSGEYKLHVDPSTIYGQGAGSYRMSRNGAEVWTRKLPFTLWDAAVTDKGVVAGYAYSLGLENKPLKPLGRDQSFNSVIGQLHLVIMEPDGVLRMDEVLPRKGMESCTTSIDRTVSGFVVDPENDRFLVRTRESGRASLEETWRTYRLSTGTLADEFKFAHPRAGKQEYWFLRSARAVAGTPLILVNWKRTQCDESGAHVLSQTGRFSLVDAGGKAVWDIDRPDDYAQAFCSGTNGERRRFNLDSYLKSNSVVLRTDQPRRFDVWFVSDGRRVTFDVVPAPVADKGWRVTEVGRADYAGPRVDEPLPATLPFVELKHVETIKLQSAGVAPWELRETGRVTSSTPPSLPPLRVIGDVTIDAEGSFYVSDQLDYFVHVFDPQGNRVRVCRPNPDDFPGPYQWGPLTVAGDGTLYLRDVKFYADGKRVGRSRWPGYFVPGTQRAWLVDDERVTLRDERGQAVRTITRRPNGDWLNRIMSHAIAPDGTLVLLTDAFDVEPRGDPSIHLYSPQGEPLRTLVPPNVENVRFLGGQIAFNGRILVVRLIDRLLVADLSTNPPTWSLAAPRLPDLDWWDFLLAPSGKELWLFSLKQGLVERYELPGTTGDWSAKQTRSGHLSRIDRGRKGTMQKGTRYAFGNA